MPYLLSPATRAWCETGRSSTVNPCQRRSVGRKRCMPSKKGSAWTASRRYTFSEQPVSVTWSPVTASRTLFATREDIRRTQVSLRRAR